MYCPHCGHQIPDEAKYCPDCGARIFDTKQEADRFSTSAQEARNTVNEYRKRFRHSSRKVQIAVIAASAAAVVIIVAVVAGSTTRSHSGGGSKPFSEYRITEAIYKNDGMSDELESDLESNPKKYLSELEGTCWKLVPTESVPYAMNACYQDAVSYADSHENSYPDASSDEDYLDRLYGWELSSLPIPTEDMETCAYIKLYNMDQLEYYGYEDGDGTYGFFQPADIYSDNGQPIAQIVAAFDDAYSTFELKNITSLHLDVPYDPVDPIGPDDDPIYLNVGSGFDIFMSSIDPNFDVETVIEDENNVYSLLVRANETQTNEDYRKYDDAYDELEKKYENLNDVALAAREYTSNALLEPVPESEYNAAYSKALDVEAKSAASNDEKPDIFADLFIKSFFYSVVYTLDDEDIDTFEDTDYQYCLMDADENNIPEIYWEKKGTDIWYMFDGLESLDSYKLGGGEADPELTASFEEAGVTFYDYGDLDGFDVMREHQTDEGLIDSTFDYNAELLLNLTQ